MPQPNPPSSGPLRHQDVPWAHIIVGGIFFLEGIWAALHTLAFLLLGSVHLNLNVFMLPLGLLFLRFHEGWRRVALLIISLRTLALFVRLIHPIIRTTSSTPNVWPQVGITTEYELYLTILLLLIHLWILRTICRPDIRRLFLMHQSAD